MLARHRHVNISELKRRRDDCGGDQGEAKGGKRLIRTVASACDSRLTIFTLNLVNIPNSLNLSFLADRRSFSVLTVQTPLIYTS